MSCATAATLLFESEKARQHGAQLVRRMLFVPLCYLLCECCIHVLCRRRESLSKLVHTDRKHHNLKH